MKKFHSEVLKPWSEFIKTANRSDKVGISRWILLDQEGRCNHCNLYEWSECLIPIELEHKDGDNTNDERDNLECLCPNCHALTPTWRGRNKKAGKRYTDTELKSALETHQNTRQALLSLGVAAKGSNYARAKRIKSGALTQLD